MPLANVNATTLSYRFDGPEEGPVVMLSNSLASDLTMWDLQISTLVDAGYRVLRYDSRGHGRFTLLAAPLLGPTNYLSSLKENWIWAIISGLGLFLTCLGFNLLYTRYGASHYILYAVI